jgi:hypothetical protein
MFVFALQIKTYDSRVVADNTTVQEPVLADLNGREVTRSSTSSVTDFSSEHFRILKK